MPAVRRNALIKAFWRAHKWLYEKSGGRVGASVFGSPVLLLFTEGRKTGLPRSNALYYLHDGENYVVAASNAGEPSHPAWWLNLKARPHTKIRVGPQMVRVVAREADGEERDRLWTRFKAFDSGYAEYERRTDRLIPVVVLEIKQG